MLFVSPGHHRIGPEFRPIYLFPHIVKMRMACKLKLYQTFLVSTTLPLCITLMTKVNFTAFFINIGVLFCMS